jgi:glycosyltransferase involved in cell wall biosynthesis
MDHSVSIIMPCYRGESFIEHSIETVEREVSLFKKDFKIIVVIDGFVDNGYNKAKALEEKYSNLKVVGYEENRGKGYAIQHGFKYSRGEYVVFMDSDLDYHPRAIGWFLEIIGEKDADLVIGNRNDKKSTFHYPFIRKIASKGFNIYTNFLFPELKVDDTQAGIKLIKREAAQKLFQRLESEQESKGFIFDIYLLVMAKHYGLKIVQAPCLFEMKSSTIGVSKNFIRTAFVMGKEVWKFRKKYYSQGKSSPDSLMD